MNSLRHHAPYIRHPESSRTVMSDAVIALVPLYFMSYFYYGSRVLFVGAFSALLCLVKQLESLLLKTEVKFLLSVLKLNRKFLN